MTRPALAARIRTEGPIRLKRYGGCRETAAYSFGCTVTTLVANLPDECLTSDEHTARYSTFRGGTATIARSNHKVDALKDKALALRMKGLPWEEVAAEIGRAKSTVCGWFTREELGPRAYRRVMGRVKP
jgi:hypothetical protein